MLPCAPFSSVLVSTTNSWQKYLALWGLNAWFCFFDFRCLLLFCWLHPHMSCCEFPLPTLVSFLPFSRVHLCLIYLLFPVCFPVCPFLYISLLCSLFSGPVLFLVLSWLCMFPALGVFLLPVSLSSILVCTSFGFVFLFSLWFAPACFCQCCCLPFLSPAFRFLDFSLLH